MKAIILLLIISSISFSAAAQSLAVNTDGSTAHTSSILDVKSTNKGLLVPRMSKAQRQAIGSPATGLLVFQNAPDSSGFYYYTGSAWDWINNPNPPKSWSIDGNSGMNEFINFLGTTDNNPLVFRTDNYERMRINPDALVGIGNGYPRYALDINYNSAAISYCDMNGLRIKSPVLPLDCNGGLVIGYNNGLIPGASDAVFWNYGQGGGNPKILFGIGNYEYMRLNDYGYLGLGQQDPKYTLDVNMGITAVNLCNRNGLRINKPTFNSDCDNGLFYGYDNSTSDSYSSLWNFMGGNDNYMRIGFGTDFTGVTGEAMRIRPNGWGVGIGTPTPQAMVHVQNKTGAGVFPGFMATSPFLATDAWGFYTGLNMGSLNYNEAMIWNFQNAGIKFGTSNVETMMLDEYGRLGIGTMLPQERLDVDGKIRSSSLVNPNLAILVADNLGNITSLAPANDGDVLTLSSSTPVWQNIQEWKRSGNSGTSPVTDFIGTLDPADLVFKTNNTEVMRLTWDGKIGMGSYPTRQMEVVGPASASPVAMVIGNKGGFGPSSLEFVSDHGLPSQWRPGYIRSNDLGGFTGSVEIYTNGTGSGNLYGNVKGLEVRNGVTYTATGTVSSFSDARLKKNIEPFNHGLDVIRRIEPVTFIYNEHSPFITSETQVGVVAQDLEKVAPYMVEHTDTKDFEDLRTVNNQAYVFLLINAVKEQDNKIERLEKKLEEQQKLIEELLELQKNKKGS